MLIGLGHLGCNKKWLSNDFGDSKLRFFFAFVSIEFFFFEFIFSFKLCLEGSLTLKVAYSTLVVFEISNNIFNK